MIREIILAEQKTTIPEAVFLGKSDLVRCINGEGNSGRQIPKIKIFSRFEMDIWGVYANKGIYTIKIDSEEPYNFSDVLSFITQKGYAVVSDRIVKEPEE